MTHPDFRVRKKIFATLGYPDRTKGMVKLTPEQQAEFVAADPSTFVPVPGGWGKKGCTHVVLAKATATKLRPALIAAWCNAAPGPVAQQFEADLKL